MRRGPARRNSKYFEFDYDQSHLIAKRVSIDFDFISDVSVAFYITITSMSDLKAGHYVRVGRIHEFLFRIKKIK